MSSLRLIFIVGLVVGLVNAQGESQLPKEFIPRDVADPYREQNLCPIMNVPGLMYNLWTCGIPYVQPYCGVMSKNVYECCPGFSRDAMIGNKCGKSEATWLYLPEHFTAHGNENFASILFNKSKMINFGDKTSKDVYTVFAPFAEDAVDEGFPLSTTRESPHPVLAGVVKNRVYSTDLKNGMVLESVYKKQKLKVTQYSNSLMFIECRALITPDHESRNGIVHYISAPIQPHETSGDDRKNVHAALLTAADAFTNDLPADVVTMLKNSDNPKWLTVFAPSNAAWRDMKSKNPSLSPEEIGMIAKNHILRKMICAGSITRRTMALGKTLAGENIGADCPKLKTRFVLDACGKQIAISRPDFMACNGVIHVIDEVLMPLASREALDAVKCVGGNVDITRTVKELEGCDLRIKQGTSYIMLIPTNAAYKWFENYMRFQPQWKRFQTDAEYRCNVYRFHVMELGDKYAKLPASWWNQNFFKTNYNPGRDTWETNYFVKYRYGSELFFHHANVNNLVAKKFKNGYIYFVDRINVLPEKTLMQIMESRSDLSVVFDKSKVSGISAEFEKDPPKWLYIVPRNKGWGNRREKNYNSLDMKNLLNLHLVKLYLWGDDIGYFHRETYTTLESNLEIPNGDGNFMLRLKRNLDGNMFIGYDNLPMEEWAMVVEWNHWGFDGIIWVVDWPLKCPMDACERGRVLPEVDTYTIYAAACIRGEDLSAEDNAKYSDAPLEISKAYAGSCVWFKVPTIEAYREWVVPKGTKVIPGL